LQERFEGELPQKEIMSALVDAKTLSRTHQLQKTAHQQKLRPPKNVPTEQFRENQPTPTTLSTMELTSAHKG
jgi:hypothetical protein